MLPFPISILRVHCSTNLCHVCYNECHSTRNTFGSTMPLAIKSIIISAMLKNIIIPGVKKYIASRDGSFKLNLLI